MKVVAATRHNPLKLQLQSFVPKAEHGVEWILPVFRNFEDALSKAVDKKAEFLLLGWDVLATAEMRLALEQAQHAGVHLRVLHPGGTAEPQKSEYIYHGFTHFFMIPSQLDSETVSHFLNTCLDEMKRDKPLEPKAHVGAKGHSSAQDALGKALKHPLLAADKPRFLPNLVVVGSSTGGPDALVKLLRPLPRQRTVPILIAQHILQGGFGELLCKRLKQDTGHDILLAQDGQKVGAGDILLAPENVHTCLSCANMQLVIRHTQSPPRHSCRPAVDELFESVAQEYHGHVLAIVLTGMGEDGAAGAQLLHKKGALVWAQDESSSAVWGMPGAATQKGVVSTLLPPEDLGKRLAGLV